MDSNSKIKIFFYHLVLLVLPGCSMVVQPPLDQTNAHRQLVHPPETFNNTLEDISERIDFTDVDTNGWVSNFNSPELETLIATGIEHNPNLAATATRLLDSEVLVNITNSSRFPNLNASFSSARAKSVFVGNTFISNDFNLGFSSQWEIDLWGKLRDQTRADLLQAKVTKQQYNAAKLSLSANVAKAYFNLLTENALLQLSAKNTRNVERIEGISVRSFKRGLVNALDVQLARRDLATAKRTLEAQNNSAQTAARTLDILLGAYPHGYQTNVQSLPGLPNNIDQGVPATVLERRPDLQAAALQVLVSETDVGAAKKALLPSIVLNGSLGIGTTELKNIFDQDFDVWSLLGTLAQPVLNRATLKGNLALEQNARERAKLEYIDLALQAMSEVENALANENSLRAQVSELTVARNYAEKSSIQARQQYEKGLVDANTLLTTERQFLTAEQTLLQTRNQLLQNRVSLYIALGGDTQALDNTVDTLEERKTP